MATPTKYKVSDNGIERDATPEEIIAIEDNKRMFEEDLAKQTQIQADKANAIAKFSALGLTPEEISALRL